MTFEGRLTRKRVLIGLGVAYWVAAVLIAYAVGVVERGRVIAAMRDPTRFEVNDPHLGHVGRAATEQGSEFELVVLMGFAALFLVLIVAWRVWLVVREDADDRIAERRAARRALFEEPPEPAPEPAETELGLTE